MLTNGGMIFMPSQNLLGFAVLNPTYLTFICAEPPNLAVRAAANERSKNAAPGGQIALYVGRFFSIQF
jgi:hypothetical protein